MDLNKNVEQITLITNNLIINYNNIIINIKLCNYIYIIYMDIFLFSSFLTRILNGALRDDNAT